MAKKIVPQVPNEEKPIHPWRICPAGQFYRRAGPVRTYSHEDGSIVHHHPRKESCIHSKSGKDLLYPEEIKEIVDNHFNNKKLKRPCPNDSAGAKSSLYDDLIGGWTQYWNDILKPDILLDPNFVKALIESESSFFNKKPGTGRDSAIGLMQVRNSTRKILGNKKGEIKDHFIIASKENLMDPDVNICAGVRWLFQKQKLASSSLGKNADWIQTLTKYKGLDLSKVRDNEILNHFLNIYRAYQQCGK